MRAVVAVASLLLLATVCVAETDIRFDFKGATLFRRVLRMAFFRGQAFVVASEGIIGHATSRGQRMTRAHFLLFSESFVGATLLTHAWLAHGCASLISHTMKVWRGSARGLLCDG